MIDLFSMSLPFYDSLSSLLSVFDISKSQKSYFNAIVNIVHNKIRKKSNQNRDHACSKTFPIV